MIQGKYADLSYCMTYTLVHDIVENIIRIKVYQLRIQVEASDIAKSKKSQKHLKKIVCYED